MNELLPIIRRKRRPLILENSETLKPKSIDPESKGNDSGKSEKPKNDVAKKS